MSDGSEQSVGELTMLLQRAARGDDAARDPLYKALYPELMRLARGHLARAGTVSLDATAILHEAYLRIARACALPDQNRRVFFGFASKVMHSVIIDYVRERGAQKRGGHHVEVTLSNVADALFAEHCVLDVEEALLALAKADERAFRVVEMRYFGGMTEEDIAALLEISPATVRRDWRRARACLYDLLR
jgi:RNA polymerase sigma factor (TIGR02999 family)